VTSRGGHAAAAGAAPVSLLCAIAFLGTFSIGAFPVLLPEMGRAGGFGDFELGLVAAAFGFARVVSDLPAGLWISRRLRQAILIGPVLVATGVVCVAAGGSLPMIVVGRALIGAGHSLTTLAGLTAILRHHAEHRLAFSLAAYDMSAMVGVLGGMALVGVLPKTWTWNLAFLGACAPQVVALLVLPRLLSKLAPDADANGAAAIDTPRPGRTRDTRTASNRPSLVLAFAAATAIALAWGAVGQFIMPMRADREFGLDRGGVASLLALPQFVDVLLLLPIGFVADRTGRSRALAFVLLCFAAGVMLIGFGSLPFAIAGCVLLGIGLAGWVLPLSLLRIGTPPHKVAWRTAQYRIAIDAGIFVGPFLCGVLGERNVWLLSASSAACLAALGIALLTYRMR
jgi:MFS family permease